MRATLENRNMENNHNDTADKGYIEEYIRGLSQQERMVMKIAEEHLETSFDVVKSIGYQEWKKARTESETSTK